MTPEDPTPLELAKVAPVRRQHMKQVAKPTEHVTRYDGALQSTPRHK